MAIDSPETTTTETGSAGLRATAPTPASDRPSDLSPRELLRWTWRQLISMRTALILLFLLALAAIPGSVIPQESVDSLRTSQWQDLHPTLTPIYSRLGLFDVFGSFWFAAIYLLLAVSLVGCILPRTMVYWRGLKAQPPAAPRRLDRLPEHRTFETTAAPEDVLAAARRTLRRRRYRLRTGADGGLEPASAERGYLREAGNLLFHLSVLVVLAGFGLGATFGFKGGVVITTGSGFANTLSAYDDFTPGKLFDPTKLNPFSFVVDKFHVTFIESGRSAGAASDFYADLAVRSSPSAAARTEKVSVNHPLDIGGTKVFLVGHGYAPHITVRDGQGNVTYSGNKVFLPEDANFRSFGVIQASDARPRQLGLEGEFYPTYAALGKGLPFSAFPDDKNPVLSMTLWSGQPRTDDGTPHSVYVLDKTGMKQSLTADGRPYRVDLKLGTTQQLPNGMGSVTFDGMGRFVRLQVSQTPGSHVALVGTILALVGLLGSLFIRPRRIWVKARREGDRTLVEVAGLDRSSGGDLSGELDEVLADLEAVPAAAGGRPGARPGTHRGTHAGPDEERT